MIAVIALFAAGFLAAALTFKRNISVSCALLVSNTAGLVLTATSNLEYHLIAFLVSAFICLFSLKDGEIKFLNEKKGYEINHAISYLYTLRVFCDLPFITGYAGAEITWLASMSLLSIQLLLAFGLGLGHGTRINYHIRRAWS